MGSSIGTGIMTITLYCFCWDESLEKTRKEKRPPSREYCNRERKGESHRALALESIEPLPDEIVTYQYQILKYTYQSQ